MYGGICRCLSPECGCRSGSTNTCLDLCNNPESTLSFLPIWKRELILKKRLNNGVGSVNVHPGCRGTGEGEAAISVDLEKENLIGERVRIANKGLVASLQAIYEPLIEIRVESPGARLACSPSPNTGSAMLARPWQPGSLHGSEPAPSPPPSAKSPQLGAGNIHPSIEGFSSSPSPSQSRSVRGRSPGPFSPDVPVVRSETRSVNGAKSGSHAAEPIPLNHYQTPSTIPTRRLSEPNRVPARTSTTSVMVEETRLKSCAASSPVDMVDNKVKGLSHKGLAWKGMMSGGNRDNEDEELQYGPGIVNKLKSRYLSRTLRERPLGESRRPSLRRAASLEDWLDKDSSPTSQLSNALIPTDGTFPILVRSTTGRSKSERPVSLNLASQVVESKPPSPSSHVGSSPAKVRDLKKTRSVDCVSQPTWKSVSVSDLVVSPSSQQTKSTVRASTPASPVVPASPKTPVHLLLSKDAIVIVEKEDSQVDKAEIKSTVTAVNTTIPPSASSTSTSKTRRTLPATNSRYNVEEAELPPPDTVRQVKRLFESGSSRKPSTTRRSQSAGPGINRTPLSAANQSTTEKLSIHRMNQVNLVNNKSLSSTTVARKKSDTTQRITEFVVDTKPVVITKPTPIGPKPSVLSPKPSLVDKSRAVPVAPTVATVSIQRSSAPAPIPTPFKPTTTPAAPVVLADKSSTVVQESADHSGDDEGFDHGFKIISKTALDNIHKDSISVKFNFDERKEIGATQSKQVGVIRPHLKSPTIPSEKPVVFDDGATQGSKGGAADSVLILRKEEIVVPPPTIASLAQPRPTKPVSPPKSHPVGRTKQIQPVTGPGPTVSLPEPTAVTDVVPSSPTISGSSSSVPLAPPADQKTTENVVNIPSSNSSQISSKGTNSTQPNTTAVIGALSPSSNPVREPKKQWHSHQSETTTVFNFVNDKARNTDHIRNEGGSTGILVYKSNDSGITKLPDYDPGESSDFIDDLDILKRPPSPCNVDFEGANIIVGKSLIQRRTKKSKFNITFNDDMTRLFEYPSETSLLEEVDIKPTSVKQNDQDLRDSTSHNSSPNPKGGLLSNYTPSKVHIETTFELGVSRSTQGDSSQPDVPNSAIQTGPVLHYIKPAEESTTWSAETTSDLLF